MSPSSANQMHYDPAKHHRRSIRLDHHDYRSEGAYFVTICTAGRACVFGEIANDEMRLSRRGMIASSSWHDIPNHRSNVELDQFIVMPNHVHGIVWIVSRVQARGTQVSPLQAGSLGAIVGGYKAAVSREINRLRPGAAYNLWQPNYFEHVIRTERALESIREYIATNVERWSADALNPDGRGSDDVEAFIRGLEDSVIKTGDASVAPTGEQRAS